MTGFVSRLAGGLARVSSRYVPDSFTIAAVLTLFTLGLALAVGGASPAQAMKAWGDGIFTLLPLSMQIALVVFTGYIVAVSPPVTRWLDALASIPRSPRQAVAFAAAASMILCWLNWGMGLIASAVLVRSLARRHPDADYRLLVAMAYIGLGTTWHAGPSGSAPLLLATPDSFMIRDGLLSAPVPLGETIFTTWNVVLLLVVFATLTGLAALLHPPKNQVVRADRETLLALGTFHSPERPDNPTPAERLMHASWVGRFLGALGAAYVVAEWYTGRFSFTLDSVNLLALVAALLLHKSPAALGRAAEEAAKPLHGIVLQFPLYAGIYGVIKDTGLVTAAANAFLSFATAHTFPLVVFLYSAVMDYLVPSGGAKWAMEAPYLLQAGQQLGVPPTRLVMAYAYGDMATNLIQPFWAIPLLGVARLDFRDIVGYEIIVLVVYASLVGVALLL